MAPTSTTAPRSERPELKYFQALEHYIAKVTTVKMQKGRLFQLALRASLSKCYEYNMMVRQSSDRDAFFWLPGLRGICEDLIVIKYVQQIDPVQREELLGLLMAHDVHSRVHRQSEFFDAVRPQQRILRIRDVRVATKDLESKIQKIWNANGWPGLKNGAMPPIRQIAEKQGATILGHLYDYLYRFSSGMVHFSMQSLLRTGWGDLQGKAMKPARFSTTNFSGYYLEVAELYGAYMFCCYFELFSRWLRLSKDDRANVLAIRESILRRRRWPEMATFEEMNFPPPGFDLAERVITVHNASQNKKLLS